jgi:capsular polysaccharide biosynthesis protein
MAPDLFHKLAPYFSYDTIDKLGPEPALTAEYAYGVAQIPNGRLWTDNLNTIAVLAADGTLLGDMSYQYNPAHAATPDENEALRMRTWTEVKHYPGTVLSLLAGGGSTNNYGHWLIDATPRLAFIKQLGLMDSIDYFLVPSTKVDYQRDSLAMLGIPIDKIITSFSGIHIQADRLIATAHPRGNKHYVLPDWIIDWNRENFLAKCLETCRDVEFSPYVYITRKDSRIRNVVNEEEVIAHLAKRGFKEYTLAELPFAQKVALFARAKIVICTSGAGLNNLMFGAAGTGVIDIFPPGMVHSQYYQIAKLLDINYSYIIASTDAPQSYEMQAGRNENVYVALAQLDQTLAEIDAMTLQTQ